MNTVVVLLCICVATSLAALGVDVSQPCMPSSFQCMKNNGYSFTVIRAGESTGNVDTNSPHTVYNAWDGGMLHVDVYIFPCFSCGNAAGQVKQVVDYLASYNAKYGMIWLDIEGPQYWSSNQGANQAFFTEMVNEAQALGVHLGVYTSASQWIPIMGNWGGGSAFPLWYAHYDGAANFNDFGAFGGWSSPAIKQFQGDASLCGCGVDLNWYP